MDNRVLIDADCKYAYSVVGGHSIFGKEFLENEAMIVRKIIKSIKNN